MKGRLREEKGKTTVELRGRRKRCSPYLREKNKTHGYLPRFIGMSGVGEAVARVVVYLLQRLNRMLSFHRSTKSTKWKKEKVGGWGISFRPSKSMLTSLKNSYIQHYIRARWKHSPT